MALRICLIAAGSYGAYALGVNNLANVSAVFVGAGILNTLEAALIGGVSIGLGILTLSRKVMETVGGKLVNLDPFSALVVVLAEAITVHIYIFGGSPGVNLAGADRSGARSRDYRGGQYDKAADPYEYLPGLSSHSSGGFCLRSFPRLCHSFALHSRPID